MDSKLPDWGDYWETDRPSAWLGIGLVIAVLLVLGGIGAIIYFYTSTT